MNELTGEIKTADAYFCGPTAMREALRSGLVSRGLRRGHFHNEEFEIRDGLGVVKLIQRVVAAMSR